MLTSHERDVLRTLNGEGDFIGGWGAWVTAVLGSLKGSGFCRLVPKDGGYNYEITEAGRRALEERDDG